MAPIRFANFCLALGRKIGMGHLRRCEALAIELAARGWQVAGFYHGNDPDENPLQNTPVAASFPVSGDPLPKNGDVLIIDSYLLNYTRRCELAAGYDMRVAFRDEPELDRSHLIIDANVGADPEAYKLAGCIGEIITGPEFFTVRPALLSLSAQAREKDRAGQATRLLITFGGSDWHHLADRTLEELAGLSCDLQVRVAAGDLGGKSARLEKALAALPSAQLVPPGSELAEQFAWADLAISAAGLTKYELALFGVPAIIVSIAENQAVVAETFASAGSARYLGWVGDLAPGALAGAVCELAADAKARALMSERGRNLVDGHGAARIADNIERIREELK